MSECFRFQTYSMSPCSIFFAITHRNSYFFGCYDDSVVPPELHAEDFTNDAFVFV